ncbi:MAG: glycosyltransferase family 2 protein [Candidatus Sulfotelmatobacter sp.]
MTPQSVCAVIITYHPSANVLANLRRLLAQVPVLVVVDNGSSPDEIDPIRRESRALGFELIENRENLGIAEALNQGVRWGKSKGHPWLILFDQDSAITENFIDHMLASWQTHPQRERVGSIYPRYVSPRTGMEAEVPRASDGTPVLPMTSGSLMPAWIFDEVGWFASEYFIDLVDWEYSFRIRAAGYLVAQAKQALLFHAPGNPATTRILGCAFHTTHHSPLRHFYIARNSIAFYRKYLFLFPRWILKVIYRQLHDTAMSLIAEEDRALKLRSFLQGTWDGLMGRMGKRDKL